MTGSRIIEYRPASREEWERASRECGYATFFHTPYWVDAFSQATGGRMVPAAKTVRFADGMIALIPLAFKSYFRLFRIYWSMPAHTFGGWLSTDPLTNDHRAALIGKLCSLRNLVWRENPYDPGLRAMPISGAESDHTHAIDLDGGFDTVLLKFDYTHRKAVKKALSAGIRITEAVGFDQWEKYFTLYAASRQRWEKRNIARGRGYNLELFRALYASRPQLRKLWLAEQNGAPVAGILCFYWNRHAVAWSGAGSEEHFKLRPNNLLYEQAIRHAAENGYRWFDCNPSAGLQGVMEFKEHLGAERLQSRVLDRSSPVRRIYEGLRR